MNPRKGSRNGFNKLPANRHYHSGTPFGHGHHSDPDRPVVGGRPARARSGYPGRKQEQPETDHSRHTSLWRRPPTTLTYRAMGGDRTEPGNLLVRGHPPFHRTRRGVDEFVNNNGSVTQHRIKLF